MLSPADVTKGFKLRRAGPRRRNDGSDYKMFKGKRQKEKVRSEEWGGGGGEHRIKCYLGADLCVSPGCKRIK
jgi:hypothetical protein